MRGCPGPRRAAAALLAAACLAAATGARGQVVRGRVVDTRSSAPVALAYVGLIAPGKALVVATLADAGGSFSLRAPEAGSYFLYVSRAGYNALMDGLFELGEGGVMELSVGLTPAPLPLDSVVVAVEGAPRNLRSAGFYERQALGFGDFLEREDIERAAVTDLTDAMHGIPGLRVVEPGVSLVVPTDLLNPEIQVRRGSAYCSPALYVDGHLVFLGGVRDRGGAARPDDFVDPSEVEAVEIYTGAADTPVEYERTGSCGVVLIWTRVR